ncbi:MAG: helix-turn-helix domain-containing protein [Candidatus Bathyarchaeia archaeon]
MNNISAKRPLVPYASGPLLGKNSQDKDKALNELHEWGFDEQEARMYLFLLKAGPQKAREICQVMNVNKVQVYRHLKNLQSRGIVESSIETPAYFSANSIERVADSIVESKRADVLMLENSRQNLLNTLKTIKSPEIPLMTESFDVVEDSNRIYSKAKESIKNAKSELETFTEDWSNAPDVKENIRLTKINANRGVKHRILSIVSEENRSYLRALYRGLSSTKNVEFRCANLDSSVFPSFVLRDREELIMIISKDPRGHKRRAMLTNNKELVNAFCILFDSVWRESKNLDTTD